MSDDGLTVIVRVKAIRFILLQILGGKQGEQILTHPNAALINTRLCECLLDRPSSSKLHA